MDERWLPTWVRDVKSVQLRLASCTIRRTLISISEHPDMWWLWWGTAAAHRRQALHQLRIPDLVQSQLMRIGRLNTGHQRRAQMIAKLRYRQKQPADSKPASISMATNLEISRG